MAPEADTIMVDQNGEANEPDAVEPDGVEPENVEPEEAEAVEDDEVDEILEEDDLLMGEDGNDDVEIVREV